MHHAVVVDGDGHVMEPEDGTEKLVNDLPGGRTRFTRDPGGYRYTIVNGVVVQAHGRSTGELPGSRSAKCRASHEEGRGRRPFTSIARKQ